MIENNDFLMKEGVSLKLKASRKKIDNKVKSRVEDKLTCMQEKFELKPLQHQGKGSNSMDAMISVLRSFNIAPTSVDVDPSVAHFLLKEKRSAKDPFKALIDGSIKEEIA